MDNFCISFAQPAVGWGLWLYIKQFIPVAEAFIPAREDDATDGNNMHLQYSKVNWMFPTTQIVTYMLNKNSPGLLKKGAAKQSRIKSIAWHLRWLVRTRADIGLRPSGLVRSRTDIKLRPSAFVRTRTDFKLQTVRLVRSCKDWYKSKYTHKSFKIVIWPLFKF